jgi:hypothetical protein
MVFIVVVIKIRPKGPGQLSLHPIEDAVTIAIQIATIAKWVARNMPHVAFICGVDAVGEGRGTPSWLMRTRSVRRLGHKQRTCKDKK